MTAYISRVVLDAIRAEAARAGEEECCGLLIAEANARPGYIDAILPASNVAADRRRRFEIDPAVLIAAHRNERSSGYRIVGCYHSHPGGDLSPSPEDAAQAEANGWLWAICAGPTWQVRLWRAIEDGPVHGRFAAVELHVEGPTKPPFAPSPTQSLASPPRSRH
ncbi:hypothetical protein BH10PSE13_BH10PSE13_19230 [soil metagenome]